MLWGEPGCGKTSLALKVVEELKDQLAGSHHFIQLFLNGASMVSPEQQKAELESALLEIGRDG